MLIGFEITFPSLLSMAKDLCLDIPHDDTALEGIYTKRNEKLNKIPRDVLHALPTSLLYSVEGMVDLDWEKLLELRCSDGSFHQSPAATAYALNQTGDLKSLRFIDGIVKKYGGGGVFEKFEKDGKFLCYPGQTSQPVTAIYNTYRAAQIAFPDEDDVLGRAEQYCRAYLQERQASNTLSDKWVISKDLPGEVGYALDFPWKVSLPRIETRFYLEQYGGSSDVWIGKVLYRMPLFCNDLFLKAAKADFAIYQRMCRLEWHGLMRWYTRNNLKMYGVCPENTLRAYFLAAANIFESNRATERLAWSQTMILTQALSSYFQSHDCTPDLREGLINKLTGDHNNDLARGAKDSTHNGILHVLDELIMNLGVFENATANLREAWKDWLVTCRETDINESCEWSTALLLVRTVEVSSGRYGLTQQDLNVLEYIQLEELTSSICCKLSQSWQTTENIEDMYRQVDAEMRELAQHVFRISCNGISGLTKQTFLHVVKSFYYVAVCSSDEIHYHTFKVIFEDII
uniref:Uncharacterized protein n=1 Tax=Avena sativa TaxID=4498 RepID=A0ACD5WRR7_AVESA